jgi:hypothetical protein
VLIVGAEELVDPDDIGTLDFIHQEDLQIQRFLALFSHLWAVFFNLKFGNDLRGVNPLNVVFDGSTVSVATGLVWVDVVWAKLMVTLLFFVL